MNLESEASGGRPALPTGAIEIEASSMPAVIALLSGLTMTVLSAIVAFRDSPDGVKSDFVQYSGYAGLLIGPLATALHFWRISKNKGAVVTLSGTGIRDTRIAPEEIPWAGIYSMATWDFQRQKALVFSVDPDIEAGLTTTFMARWSRKANKRYGADGLVVSASGLQIDHDSLGLLCADRIKRAHMAAPVEAGGAAKSL